MTALPHTTPTAQREHDSFGSAEVVSEQESLVRVFPVGFKSQLSGSMPTPARHRPEPHIDATTTWRPASAGSR